MSAPKGYQAAYKTGPVSPWPGEADGYPPGQPWMQHAPGVPEEIAAGVFRSYTTGNLNWSSAHTEYGGKHFLFEVDQSAIAGQIAADPLVDLPYRGGFGSELWLAGEGHGTGAPEMVHSNYPYLGNEDYGIENPAAYPVINLARWTAKATVRMDFTGGEDEGGGHLYYQLYIFAPTADAASFVASAVEAYFPIEPCPPRPPWPYESRLVGTQSGAGITRVGR